MKAAVLAGPRGLRLETRVGPGRGCGRGAGPSPGGGDLRNRLPDLDWRAAGALPPDPGARVHRRRRGGGARCHACRPRSPSSRRAELGLRLVRSLPGGERKPLPGADRGGDRPGRRVRRAVGPARTGMLASASRAGLGHSPVHGAARGGDASGGARGPTAGGDGSGGRRGDARAARAPGPEGPRMPGARRRAHGPPAGAGPGARSGFHRRGCGGGGRGRGATPRGSGRGRPRRRDGRNRRGRGTVARPSRPRPAGRPRRAHGAAA